MTGFRATYAMAEDPYSDDPNDGIFFRQFEADDFLHAVKQAEDAREEGEILVNVHSQPVVQVAVPHL